MQHPRRLHVDGRIGWISRFEARRNGGARRPLGKNVLTLKKCHRGSQWPQSVHDKKWGGFGPQADGSRVAGYGGRDKDDVFNTTMRGNLPGAKCKEAGVLCHVAAHELALQWGTTPHPTLETDPVFTMHSCRFNISGAKPEKVFESDHSLDDDALTLWANTPQDKRAFEHAIYLCLIAVDGECTGLPVVDDMPGGGFVEKQAKLMAKWLCSLLAMPDYWPTTGCHAQAHAPRMHRLRAMFLVESKWTEARHLIQPVMAAHAYAFDELNDTSNETHRFAFDEQRLSPSTSNDFDASGDGARMRMCDV